MRNKPPFHPQTIAFKAVDSFQVKIYSLISAMNALINHLSAAAERELGPSAGLVRRPWIGSALF